MRNNQPGIACGIQPFPWPPAPPRRRRR